MIMIDDIKQLGAIMTLQMPPSGDSRVFLAKPSANACSIHDRHSWQQHVDPDENEDETPSSATDTRLFWQLGERPWIMGLQATSFQEPLECRSGAAFFQWTRRNTRKRGLTPSAATF